MTSVETSSSAPPLSRPLTITAIHTSESTGPTSPINDEIYLLSIPLAKSIKSSGMSDNDIDEKIPEWRSVCSALVQYKQHAHVDKSNSDRMTELHHLQASLMKIRQFFTGKEEIIAAIDKLEAEIEKTLLQE